MAKPFERDVQFVLRTALAKQSYRDNLVRVADPELGAVRWLASTQRGLHAVSEDGTRLLVHGWFFGMARRGERLFLFENCARHDRHLPMGRLVSIAMKDGVLRDPVVIASGLDAWCHQIAFVDDLLCVLDTANQRILRFTEAGEPVDVVNCFRPAHRDDGSSEYMHINTITPLPGGVAIMAHNGKRVPALGSEIIMLDRAWQETGRTVLAEPGCHDLARDAEGLLWHCESVTGTIVRSDGRRVQVTPDRMTRGLLFDGDRVLVGASVFGERSRRDILPGSVFILDRDLRRVGEVPIGGPPCQIIAL